MPPLYTRNQFRYSEKVLRLQAIPGRGLTARMLSGLPLHWDSPHAEDMGIGVREQGSVLPLRFSFRSRGMGHLLWMSMCGHGSSFRLRYVTPRCSWYVSTKALRQTQK